MTDREFFMANIDAEIPRFEGVWKALPEEKLDYRPHEKNQSAIELLKNMTVEASMYPVFLKEGAVDFEKIPPLQTRSKEGLWEIFRKGLEDGKRAASELTDKEWDTNSKLVAGGQTHWETTKCWMAWGFLLDLVHHRGQLSVYIRPMGGKVPSIYGPSGDSAQ